MKLNDMKIGTRLTVVISSIVVFMMLLMIIILRSNIVTLQKENAKETGTEMATLSVMKFKAAVEVPLDEVRSLANMIEDSLSTGAVPLSRNGINEILKGHLKKRKNIIGVYVGFEPNAFDGRDGQYVGAPGHDKTGRYIPYFTWGSEGKINLDPLVDYDKDGAGDYYQIPKKTGKEAIIEPYEYEVGGKKILMTSLVVPIFNKSGKFIGIAGADIGVSNLQEEYSKIRLMNTGFLNFFSGKGMFVATGSGLDIIGRNIADIVPSKEYIDGVLGTSPNFDLQYTSTKTGVDYTVFGAKEKIGNSDSYWGAAINIPDSEIMADANRVTTIIIFIGIFVIAMIVTAVYFISRMISQNLEKGVSFAAKIASGDFTDRVDLDQKDEVGNLAKSLNTAADNLEKLISEVIMASQNLVRAVEEIASGNENLSQRTAEQASSLEEIAATVEETNASTRQNAGNANEGNKLAENSSKLAVDGGLIVEKAVSSIGEINSSSKKISEIITMINEISFQTNLLALNAAVEAARAGEQGRGFAVVAGEVRNLAQRSAGAAKEIGTLIKDSISKIDEGTSLVNKSGEALKDIIISAKQVKDIISEIAASSDEQSRGIDQITTAVNEMDTMTQQNAALVEQTAAASEEMSNQAQELLSMVQKFQIRDSLKNITSVSKRKEVHIRELQTKKSSDKPLKSEVKPEKNYNPENDGYEKF